MFSNKYCVVKLFVLISTLDEGIRGVPEVLLPHEEGVHYVVVWQHSPQHAASRLGIDEMKERVDVTLVEMEGVGLSRSRNKAMEVAVGLLSNPLEDAVMLVADDDERLLPDAFERIRSAYESRPKLDAALFRLRSSIDHTYFKAYPSEAVSYRRRPRYYYPCSCELTLRCRVWQTSVRFDERFGLGAAYLCAGEEDVLLTDIERRGLHVLIVPADIAETDPLTTGSRVLEARVLRSKGGVYAYQLSLPLAFLRSWREALSLAVRHRSNPWRLFREIWSGVKYIRYECADNHSRTRF